MNKVQVGKLIYKIISYGIGKIWMRRSWRTNYTLFSISRAGHTADSTTRIASNIVMGIGFLGAGTILSDGGRIGGLTTAATIWLAVALGMGIAAGEIEDVLVATGVALIVLLIFPRLVSENHMQISEDAITTSWRIIGTLGNHDKFVRTLVRNKDIVRLEY